MCKDFTTVSFLMAGLGYLCSFDLPPFLCASQISLCVIVVKFPCTGPFLRSVHRVDPALEMAECCIERETGILS